MVLNITRVLHNAVRVDGEADFFDSLGQGTVEVNPSTNLSDRSEQEMKLTARLLDLLDIVGLHLQDLNQGVLPTIITVGYGDRTPKKAGFNKEGTFGPSFGRALSGEASKSASGRPKAGRRPILRRPPTESGQNPAQKCPPY
jgi:hypothetical protein